MNQKRLNNEQSMDFKYNKLNRGIIEDLLGLEQQGAKGLLERQIKRFFIELPEFLQSIETSIERKDFGQLRESSHKLNGFSGLIGALKIREISLEIEKDAIDNKIENLNHLNEKLVSISKETIEELERFLIFYNEPNN